MASEYSQGVCHDGTAILKDGQPMRVEEILAELRAAQSRTMLTAAPAEQGELVIDPYDAGSLNDFGGGDVAWWHGYIRAELDRAHEFYLSQLAEQQQHNADLAAHVERLKGALRLAGGEISTLTRVAIGRGAKVNAALDIWPEEIEKVLAESPTASLDRLKAQWQAELYRKAQWQVELYEALEGIMRLEARGRVMPVGAEWDAARAALARARGES